MRPSTHSTEAETAASLPSARARSLNMLAPPSRRFLLALAALKHGVRETQIMSPARATKIVAARYEAMGLVYQHTQASMPKVGCYFDRDHTTVLHGLRKIGATTKLVEKWVPTPSPQKPPRVTRPGRDGLGRFLPRPKPKTALQRAVKRAYENNVPPSVVADEYGCNPLSVKVIAHRMWLKRSDFRPKAKYHEEVAR